MKLRLPNVKQYTAIVATLALIVSTATLVGNWLSVDLNRARDARELSDADPAIDVQVTPTGASAADLTITVFNRSNINISPLDLEVERSIDAGDLFLSLDSNGFDDLNGRLTLTKLGSVAPKQTTTINAKMAGTTDGKADSLKSGLELKFRVKIRFSDAHDTIKQFSFVRRIL